MFCSNCGYHISHSDLFCSGCGLAMGSRSTPGQGLHVLPGIARDIRLLTGSRRAMKVVIIPLIGMVLLVAAAGALGAIFRSVLHP